MPRPVLPITVLPEQPAAWGLLVAVAASPCAAGATPLAILCDGKSGQERYELVYEGGASGTLSLEAPFGTSLLPAKREERSRGGHSVVGIVGIANADLLMPDIEEIRACIAGAVKDQYHDAELERMKCIDLSPLSDGAVPVAVHVSVAIIEPPYAHVEITRTFPDVEIDGKAVSIYSFPNGCVLKAQ